jgi:hypothetical protein
MSTLLQKYGKYMGGKDIINNVYNHVNNKYGYKQYIPIQIGGSIETVNEILKKYTDINAKVDLLESTDDEVRIMVLTIDDKLVCAFFVLNYENKVCEIIDLRSNSKCIKTSEKFIPKIIEIIKGIAKSTRMESIELSDNSYHNCANSTNNFKLDIGNTLSGGYPYYYKYGFKYQDRIIHDRVKYNFNVLEKMQTKDYQLDDIIKIILFEIEDLNYDQNKIIKKIRKIYDKCYEKNIKTFMKYVKYNLCDIFSLTCDNLFRFLGLKNYGNSKIMVYKL